MAAQEIEEFYVNDINEEDDEFHQQFIDDYAEENTFEKFSLEHDNKIINKFMHTIDDAIDERLLISRELLVRPDKEFYVDYRNTLLVLFNNALDGYFLED